MKYLLDADFQDYVENAPSPPPSPPIWGRGEG